MSPERAPRPLPEPPSGRPVASDADTALHMPGLLVSRLVVVAVLAVALSGALAAWLVSHAAGQEAVRRVVVQQTDEVEVLARVLASKIEQHQKVLRTVAVGITPGMVDAPSSLEWRLQQGLPAVQFFDSVQVVRGNGDVRVNLRAGQRQSAADLEPAERDALRRTLADGKPRVAEVVAGRISEARVIFTMPLHREDGSVFGAIAGALRMQSPGLLPPTLPLPAREDSRLIVFTRDGVILSHSDPKRILGRVGDEPALGSVFAQWQDQPHAMVGGGASQVMGERIVSLAGMPLPQWVVARVSESKALLEPLEGPQRNAWWLAAASMLAGIFLLAGIMFWMAQPLLDLTRSARHLLRGSQQASTPDNIPWPNTDGEVGELVTVFKTLEQQGDQEQRTRATLDSQLRAILDNVPVGIVIARAGMLEVVGRQAGVMLGYEPAALEGRPTRLLYASDAEYTRVCVQSQAALAAHGAFNADVCFHRADGTSVWARIQGRLMHERALDEGTVWILEDLTAVREAQLQTDWASLHDPITQLLNRPAFEERLRVLLAERAERQRERASGAHGGVGDARALAAVEPGGGEDGVLLFLDLDHFTLINEVAGHAAGDEVLRHVARLLEQEVRQIGWVARLGGDEFGVVLPGSSLARGQAVAEQVRAVVQAWEPEFGGRSFTLGVSIGLVVLDAGLQDAASVMSAADMACYDAKRAGRNRIEMRYPGKVAASAGDLDRVS